MLQNALTSYRTIIIDLWLQVKALKKSIKRLQKNILIL